MTQDDFWQGIRGGFPVMVSASPFGALFGALAIDNGFSVFDAVFMSATLYAGASQMVGIELFGGNVPAWVIVASILAVNFRHILYSAAIAKHIRHFTALQKFFTFFLLVDPQFAETVKRGESGKRVTFAWYFGFGIIIYIPWVLISLLGGVLGSFIGDPRTLGLDILLPTYFLGIVLGFRNRDNFLPVALVSAVASVIAYHLVGSPWHVSLGAAAGILLAALLPLPSEHKPEPVNEPHEV
jgi:4-azaleucine resistance transporter AzlC